MNIKDYQKFTQTTDTGAVVSGHIGYLTLGLVDEAGEVAGKFKKLFRDFDGEMSAEYRLEIIKELGDVLWYMTRMADELGTDLEEIAEINRDKLQSRKDRGVIKGSGDNR